jgi:hypothetical protein
MYIYSGGRAAGVASAVPAGAGVGPLHSQGARYSRVAPRSHVWGVVGVWPKEVALWLWLWHIWTGMSISKVQMDLGKVWEYGQGYVGTCHRPLLLSPQGHL